MSESHLDNLSTRKLVYAYAIQNETKKYWNNTRVHFVEHPAGCLYTARVQVQKRLQELKLRYPQHQLKIVVIQLELTDYEGFPVP